MLQAIPFRVSSSCTLKHPSEILRRGIQLLNKSIKGGLAWTNSDGGPRTKEHV